MTLEIFKEGSMKKKILLSLLVIVTLFTITGCGTGKKGDSTKKEEKVVDKTLFKIKDKEFHIDTDKEFEGLKYKVSSEFREINNYTPSSTYMQYSYQPEDSSNYFYLRILYLKLHQLSLHMVSLAVFQITQAFMDIGVLCG
jgi:hypothetical protein